MTKHTKSKADKSCGQARWERAEGSVGPERITKGKEWTQREEVTARVMMRERE